VFESSKSAFPTGRRSQARRKPPLLPAQSDGSYGRNLKNIRLAVIGIVTQMLLPKGVRGWVTPCHKKGARFVLNSKVQALALLGKETTRLGPATLALKLVTVGSELVRIGGPFVPTGGAIGSESPVNVRRNVALPLTAAAKEYP
jgi:hypothetical protein